MSEGPTRRTWIVGGVGMGLISLWPRTGRAAAGLSGDFVLIDPKRQRDLIDAEIERLVDELNVLVRGIARRRLKETVIPAPALRISVGDAFITVIEPAQPKKRAPADGSKVRWTNSVGDRVSMQMWVAGGDLHERFRGQGNRDNVYSRDGESRLTLRSKISSKHFPRPIRFTLPYRPV